jgi:hypothetical protein
VKTIKKKIIDILERSGATFAQAFIAIEIADQANVTQLGALKTAAVAGGLAVGKYLLVQANAYLRSPDPYAPATTEVPPAA